jgi:cell division protein FtsW (lipid II flippase)
VAILEQPVGTVGFTMSLRVLEITSLVVVVGLAILVAHSLKEPEGRTAEQRRNWHLQRRVRFIVGLATLLSVLGVATAMGMKGRSFAYLSYAMLLASLLVAERTGKWLERTRRWPFMPGDDDQYT